MSWWGSAECKLSVLVAPSIITSSLLVCVTPAPAHHEQQLLNLLSRAVPLNTHSVALCRKLLSNQIKARMCDNLILSVSFAYWD